MQKIILSWFVKSEDITETPKEGILLRILSKELLTSWIKNPFQNHFILKIKLESLVVLKIENLTFLNHNYFNQTLSLRFFLLQAVKTRVKMQILMNLMKKMKTIIETMKIKWRLKSKINKFSLKSVKITHYQ